MAPTITLPAWATLAKTRGARPRVDVDANAMYESWLAELGVEDIDQYWLEVAYQCGKMELQLAMGTFAFDIHIHDTEKRYALKNHPPGRGAARATRGKEAREHFRRLRGRLP